MVEFALSTAPAHSRHGSNSGQPLSRVDGALKVTGRAPYAADRRPENMLYAALAVATISRGRVASINIEAAKAHLGVVEVMTTANRPPIFVDPDKHDQPFNFCMDLLQNDRVRYANQPIAVVIAHTLEAATEGAALLTPSYETEPPRVHLDASPSYVPPMVGVGNPPSAAKSDTATALSEAELSLDAIYETAAQYHNAMEPHAIVASFENGKLVVDTSSQGLTFAAIRLAQIFGMDPQDVLVRSPYLGGGFGGKGLLSGPQVLGALAAKLVERPVKLVVTRV